MAKKKSVSRKNISRKNTKLSTFSIIMISSMLTLIIGVIFAVIQYVGETTGVLPIMNLGELDWGMDGDVIIIFIIGAAIAYGVRENEISNSIKYLTAQGLTQSAQIIESQKNDREHDKIYTEMNTNIKWIMEALVEIKEEIK